MSFYEKTYCAGTPIENARFPPFGFDTAEISSNLNQNMSFLQKEKRYCARILMERARFPPVGFDTVDISSSLNENMSLFAKRLVVPGF